MQFQWFAFNVFTSVLEVLVWGDKSHDCKNQNVSGEECSKLANVPMFICGAVYCTLKLINQSINPGVAMIIAVGWQTFHLNNSMKLKDGDGFCGACFLIPK